MLVSDLISELQKIIDYSAQHESVLGPAVITIDSFDWNTGEYKGISQDIIIDYTSDGVYPVLTAKPYESSKESAGTQTQSYS